MLEGPSWGQVSEGKLLVKYRAAALFGLQRNQGFIQKVFSMKFGLSLVPGMPSLTDTLATHIGDRPRPKPQGSWNAGRVQ